MPDSVASSTPSEFEAATVPARDVTVRTATAAGRVLLAPAVVELLRGAGVPKGDTLAVARLAGIMGTKRTPELIPLGHPIALHGVEVADMVKAVDPDLGDYRGPGAHQGRRKTGPRSRG